MKVQIGVLILFVFFSVVLADEGTTDNELRGSAAAVGQARPMLIPRPALRILERQPCSCAAETCGCCASIDLRYINFSEKGCMNFTVALKDLSVKLDLLVNDKSIYRTGLSARNPPPLCVPLPMLPAVALCVRVYDIHWEDGALHVCANLEATVFSTPALVIPFDCIRLGPGGVDLVRPSASTSQFGLFPHAPRDPSQRIAASPVPTRRRP
ncbi:uncharacterized protein LOC126263106 [Schistocerca nitens]|uniref:uncharacterized protein LOC126263106 n=1 Tax=Schistocerca nitens TaxID=7011 RepID=UPI0021172E7C|nr:uncharacterized protein LOC126263106 [Schistocerca nitens]